MGQIAKLVVFTGDTRRNRNGKERQVSEQIGTLNVNDKGVQYILLKKSVNLAGFPAGEHANSGNILVHLFHANQNEEDS